MAQTFETIWRRARLEMPAVPPLLVRAWAQEAFEQLCDSWGWAFLRGEGTLVTLASRAVEMTFTNGSTTVTSAAGFVATDAGRQIQVANLPIYTIASYTDPNTVVLDRAYTEVSDTITATIRDVYTVLPTDFRRFVVIYDRYYQRVVPFDFTEDSIAVVDPGRRITGPVRYIISQGYSTATATLGQVRYEYWPAPTSARTYPYLYIKKATTLADSDVLPGVLATRSDLLRAYCKWQGALWPGTTDLKNPFFSAAIADRMQTQWLNGLQQLQLVDDNEYPQQLMLINWARRVGSLAPTAELLRETDATVNDYY